MARTIVTISGTSRPGNYTSKALAVVRNELESRGIEIVHFDARELELNFPGFPDTDDAKAMAAAVRAADAVVFATPEYHGSLSAMAKLIIENMGFPSALKGKPIAMLGVAAGRIGAIKTLEQLRSIFGHVGAIVLPYPVSVARVQTAFDDDGTCTDEDVEQMLHGLADQAVNFIGDYICPRYELEAVVRDQTNDRHAAAM